MTLRRVAAVIAAALALLAAGVRVNDVRRERRAAALRARADLLQAQAEQAHLAGHPWAGVYITMRELYADQTLIVAPDGDFFAMTFEPYEPAPTAYAFGHAAFKEPTLELSPGAPAEGDRSRFAGSYRLVRWGGVRCLIRPGEEKRFLDCAAAECKDFHPACTRGLLYGEPDLPEEAARARRAGKSFYSSIRDKAFPPEFLSYNPVKVRQGGGRR